MAEMHLHVTVVPAVTPKSYGDNTPIVSAIVDTTGFHDAELVIHTGTIADADAAFAVLLEHGNAADLSDAAAVDDDELLGTEAAAGFTFAADNATRKLGYIGVKRYLRATITPTGNSAGAEIGAVWLLSGARKF